MVRFRRPKWPFDESRHVEYTTRTIEDAIAAQCGSASAEVSVRPDEESVDPAAAVVGARPLRSSAASRKLQLDPGYEQADLLIGMSLFELDTTSYGWRGVGDDFLEELGAIATAIAAGQVTERLLLYRGDASPVECIIETRHWPEPSLRDG